MGLSCQWLVVMISIETSCLLLVYLFVRMWRERRRKRRKSSLSHLFFSSWSIIFTVWPHNKWSSFSSVHGQSLWWIIEIFSFNDEYIGSNINSESISWEYIQFKWCWSGCSVRLVIDQHNTLALHHHSNNNSSSKQQSRSCKRTSCTNNSIRRCFLQFG